MDWIKPTLGSSLLAAAVFSTASAHAVPVFFDLTSGGEAGPALEAELIAFCKENISSIKSPRSIDFEEELPRHPTGKLYKRLLKDKYWQ